MPSLSMKVSKISLSEPKKLFIHSIFQLANLILERGREKEREKERKRKKRKRKKEEGGRERMGEEREGVRKIASRYNN